MLPTLSFNINMSASIKTIPFYKKNFFRYGLPFLLLVVGGSFGLKEFAQIRYQFSKKSSMTIADFEKEGIPMKKPGEVTLETEYDKLKDLDIDNWVQVRGPRPWEEDTHEAIS